MSGFATRAVHGPRTRKEAFGALRLPLYDSVAFEFDSAQAKMKAINPDVTVKTYHQFIAADFVVKSFRIIAGTVTEEEIMIV